MQGDFVPNGEEDVQESCTMLEFPFFKSHPEVLHVLSLVCMMLEDGLDAPMTRSVQVERAWNVHRLVQTSSRNPEGSKFRYRCCIYYSRICCTCTASGYHLQRHTGRFWPEQTSR